MPLALHSSSVAGLLAAWISIPQVAVLLGFWNSFAVEVVAVAVAGMAAATTTLSATSQRDLGIAMILLNGCAGVGAIITGRADR